VVEKLTGIAHLEMTFSVPQSVPVLWAMSGAHDRPRIERALLGGGARCGTWLAKRRWFTTGGRTAAGQGPAAGGGGGVFAARDRAASAG